LICVDTVAFAWRKAFDRQLAKTPTGALQIDVPWPISPVTK